MQAAKSLASQLICAGLPKPSLLADGISTEILSTDPYTLNIQTPKTITIFTLKFGHFKAKEQVL